MRLPKWVRPMRRPPGLGADIWDLLKGGGKNLDLDSPKRRGRVDPRTQLRCEQLAQFFQKTWNEIQDGSRPQPNRTELKSLITKEFGLKTSVTIDKALHGRCSDIRWMYQRMSRSDAYGFTREASAASRARMAQERTRFSCDQLEQALRSTDNHAGENLARILATAIGSEVPKGTVYSAIKKRCRHLYPLWSAERKGSKRGRGVGGPKFSCEKLKDAMQKHGWPGASAPIAAELGVHRNAVYYALQTRCRHLNAAQGQP